MSKPTTSQRRIAKLILDRWKAELTKMDRSFDNIAANFDELVSNMYLAETPFELAEENINAGIIEHYPSEHLAKIIWKGNKAAKKIDKDFPTFYVDWKKAINSEGKQVFFSYYSLPSDETVNKNKKTTGSVSVKEHRAQRRYAESFPILDTSTIEVKIKKVIGDMEEDFMKTVLGEDDE